MNKLVRKVVVAIMALVMTIAMVVTVSYAWFTLSDSPAVDGIQITIGGGNTILIAPDVASTVGGTTYHYPGYFQSSMIFSQYEQYDYLQDAAGLSPVSTADGVHWYLPTYYDYNDIEVVNGETVVGALKPIYEFRCDADLTHANLEATQHDTAQEGCYVYLDFWVVSPGGDYTLRVSKGDSGSGSGSYLLETPTPTVRGNGEYELTEADGYAAATARVGFLVCQDRIVDETNLQLYQSSPYYNALYPELKGMYQQPGEDPVYTSGYRFTVYEPNADLHPNGTQGTYMQTFPVGYEGGRIVYADMRDKLTVQLSNKWISQDHAAGISIWEAFDVWCAMKKAEGEHVNPATIRQEFYRKYLQNQYAPYVDQGRFVSLTQDLYRNGNASVNVGNVVQANATTDTYIVRLEKNIPQRIRMFIWLEGQDPDCNNQSQGAEIALGLELAGGHE